jgi:hypothetical protein
MKETYFWHKKSASLLMVKTKSILQTLSNNTKLYLLRSFGLEYHHHTTQVKCTYSSHKPLSSFYPNIVFLVSEKVTTMPSYIILGMGSLLTKTATSASVAIEFYHQGDASVMCWAAAFVFYLHTSLYLRF